MRITIEMPDGQGGIVTRAIEVPDPEPRRGQGTQHDQGMQDAGSTAHDAGAGAWDAGPAPSLGQLLSGLPQGAAGQPGLVAAPVPAQPPEQFRAESFGIEAGKGGRDAGPAQRRSTPVTGSAMPSFSAAAVRASDTQASSRDAGTAPRRLKRRTKG